MSEILELTTTKTEEIIDQANRRLHSETRLALQGGSASRTVAAMAGRSVLEVLTEIQTPGMPGLHEPFGANTASTGDLKARIDQTRGSVVLVPSVLVDRSAPSAFYPGVISPDSAAYGGLRVELLKFAYDPERGISEGVHTALSEAAQAESPGIGVCGSDANGPELLDPIHFDGLVYGAADPNGAYQRLLNGEHINHDWEKPSNSVTANTNREVLGVPQVVLTLTADHFRAGAKLFWHRGLVDPDGRPLSGDVDNALVFGQGAKFLQANQDDPHVSERVAAIIE